jgi:hypothetical protein
MEALRKKERTGWNSSLPPDLVEKTSFGSYSYIVLKKSSLFSVTRLMPYYAETGHSRPLIAWLYWQLYCTQTMSLQACQYSNLWLNAKQSIVGYDLWHWSSIGKCAIIWTP